MNESIEWEGDQWQQWVQGQAWRRTGVEWTMEAGNLRPVAVVTTEVEHRGRAPTRVVIDEAWGQVVEWGETMHGEGTALGTAQFALWAAAGLFGAQAVLHWLRATCWGAASRAEGHELLSCAATAASALLYLGMANGISLTTCAGGGGVPSRAASAPAIYELCRIQYHIFYLNLLDSNANS